MGVDIVLLDEQVCLCSNIFSVRSQVVTAITFILFMQPKIFSSSNFLFDMFAMYCYNFVTRYIDRSVTNLLLLSKIFFWKFTNTYKLCIMF